MTNNLKVTVTSAQELIKDVRLLATCGRASFRKYLYQPLFEAGWQIEQSGQNRRKLIERLKQDSADPAFLQTIAPRCKKIIGISMKESLASLGESSIFFLERMQMHVTVSSSVEAVEFADILNNNFFEFRKNNSEKSEELFIEAVLEADPSDIKSAYAPVKLGDLNEKIRLDKEIQRLYENIRIASQYYNIPKCRKLLSSYIIRYSDSDDYAHDDVEKLIKALNNREPGFEDELKNNIAIDLYYKITHGVLKGDIFSTITSIRKYGYIFEGDSSAKYFYDIDRLERTFYKIITEKGLWDDLKNKKSGGS